MTGWTLHIAGEVVWFAFGFLAATALWVGLGAMAVRSVKQRQKAPKGR